MSRTTSPKRFSRTAPSKSPIFQRITMIRYGILGFGHHAAKRLVPAFAASQESRLVGLWRRDLAKAQANARDFEIPHAFETAEALCSSSEIDAVFVASPDSLHLNDVLLALAHGKPVLCE